MTHLFSSPKIAPEYVHNRHVTANDATPETVKSRGINMKDCRFADIQIVPDGTSTKANPVVEIQYWCDAKGEFISEHTALSFAAKGAGAAWHAQVESHGRIMFIKIVSGIAATQWVDVYVTSFGVGAR